MIDFAKLHLHWRVSQHKGKSYRSYRSARAFREEEKNRKEIILKLGKLSESEIWLLNFTTQSVNAARIFRELVCIEESKEALCQHLFMLLKQKDPEAMSTVFYDLSSTTFTGSKCILMKWGHCKEGYKNHVVLAIVVNKKSKDISFYKMTRPDDTQEELVYRLNLSHLLTPHILKKINSTSRSKEAY